MGNQQYYQKPGHVFLLKRSFIIENVMLANLVCEEMGVTRSGREGDSSMV